MAIVQLIIEVLIIGGNIFIGIRVLKFLARKVARLSAFLRLLIVSFGTALIFGIGAAASGGDPGFAFPVPIPLAALWTNPDLIVSSAIIPFGFWWIVFFLTMTIKHAWYTRQLNG